MAWIALVLLCPSNNFSSSTLSLLNSDQPTIVVSFEFIKSHFVCRYRSLVQKASETELADKAQKAQGQREIDIGRERLIPVTVICLTGEARTRP